MSEDISNRYGRMSRRYTQRFLERTDVLSEDMPSRQIMEHPIFFEEKHLGPEERGFATEWSHRQSLSRFLLLCPQ